MHLMRPDWDEATATHTLRSETEPWTTPGATGTDRSNPLCTTVAYDGFDVTCRFTFEPTDLAADWTGDLSIQLRAVSTATGVFGSHEGRGQCVDTPVARAIATCRRVAGCGNGMIDAGEGCDDGNTQNGDGCSDGCAFETSMPVCGNSRLETGESCDDGNTVSGDGCSATCTIEASCGNGVQEGAEECDDGNSVPLDGCTTSCLCTTLECTTH